MRCVCACCEISKYTLNITFTKGETSLTVPLNRYSAPFSWEQESKSQPSWLLYEKVIRLEFKMPDSAKEAQTHRDLIMGFMHSKPFDGIKVAIEACGDYSPSIDNLRYERTVVNMEIYDGEILFGISMKKREEQ